ncbi:MAG: indolepyruvate oxidoreductase subunit beta, partial [Dehalococcoidia bacterium]|nr:indolepyruvate oxidoreductase subunit beta [Dehalococcoidia bacterium]
VGGQGNVLLSAFVGTALLNEGFMVSVADTFGVSQRGGSVTSHIKISRKTLYSSVTLEGKADVILGMEPVETLRALGEFGNPHVVVIVNPRPVYPSGGVAYPDVDEVKQAIIKLSSKTKFVNATEEALKMGNPIYSNIILLGSLVGANVLPISKETMMPILEDRFPGNLLDTNIKAFDKGMELIANA